MNFCPNCGKQEFEDEGTVFIEDGPWDGKQYLNEGDWPRYRCKSCQFVFGEMPEPLKCGCGNYICGELGEECDQDPEYDEGVYLCEDCMRADPEERIKQRMHRVFAKEGK